MSENKKPKTITIVTPSFEQEEVIMPQNIRGVGETLKTFINSKSKEVDYKKSLEEFNKRIFEILNLLSDSKSDIKKFEDFQIDSVTFSLGVQIKGEVAVFGIGGVSTGADSGIKITINRQKNKF
ncbi:MAG: hypothetical protein KO217_05155 [Methanobacteriaceae archaeon]|jgi:hypothetical protein|nr:MAG: hypothetical protein CIT01_07540 [Methanobacterium sp. BRmetb2]MCC7558060.1 hypothetical protein [Methanobacteriaceae archaeon]